MSSRIRCVLLFALLSVSSTAFSQAHSSQAAAEHGHGEAQLGGSPKAPKIFLDKSPKVVEYQLKRLTNAELLLVERSADHAKYGPVYSAILVRAGLPSGERRASAEALAKIKSTSIAEEILTALTSFSTEDGEASRSARDLVSLLLSEPLKNLQDHENQLRNALNGGSIWSRRAATAGLLIAGQSEKILKANEQAEKAIDFLIALGWIGDVKIRDSFRNEVLLRLGPTQPTNVRLQAIRALATLQASAMENFTLLSQLSSNRELGDEAIKAILQIPAAHHDKGLIGPLAKQLVESAEATSIALRTGDGFVDRAQLLESLLPELPVAISKAYRDRMRAVAVRVVRIRTVEEEMRYDVKYFVVEAGKPVEILLKNDDLMPHNLVITAPGALKEVALAAAKMPPDLSPGGKQYVPESEKVLLATTMIPAGKQERLAFSAPVTPGEYPFVCTFPNHWMRMYGVMVVVSDLDVWQKNPTIPADPIGNNRSFVRKWTTADLNTNFVDGLRGRSKEIGARLFKEATCAQCHKFQGTGGNVGPDLTDISKRWKGDALEVLKEILEPSLRIESKYAVQSVLTSSGKVYSGILVAEDKDSLALITSPEQLEPTKIPRDDIDEIVKSSKSIMPLGLLDQYTQDEIFEILNFITK